MGMCVNTIPNDRVKALFQQCCQQAVEHIKQVTKGLNAEFNATKTYTCATLKDVMQTHPIAEMIQKEAFEPEKVNAACSDTSVQNLYALFAFGRSGLVAAADSLKEISGFCTSYASEFDVFNQGRDWTDSLLKDVTLFVDGGMDNQSGLVYLGHIVGSVTLAQSMMRELKTGETRQNLCHHALQGVRKVGFTCCAGLVKKCEAIASGKPLK